MRNLPPYGLLLHHFTGHKDTYPQWDCNPPSSSCVCSKIKAEVGLRPLFARCQSQQQPPSHTLTWTHTPSCCIRNYISYSLDVCKCVCVWVYVSQPNGLSLCVTWGGRDRGRFWVETKRSMFHITLPSLEKKRKRRRRGGGGNLAFLFFRGIWLGVYGGCSRGKWRSLLWSLLYCLEHCLEVGKVYFASYQSGYGGDKVFS